MKVTANQDVCASSGNCVMYAGEVFDQRDDDGVVVVINDNPSADLHDAVRRAVAGCPTRAIQIEE